jgi:NADPH:quinone reductase-like Zn-dependent oxidoreductase
MLIAAAFWLISTPMWLVSRAQIFSLFPISGRYIATTSEIMKAAYLASAERALELANIYATMGLMFLGVACILIGLVMLKGVFGKRVGYLVTVAGTCILIGTFGIFFNPIALLVPIGLILNAAWQTIVGIKLYKPGMDLSRKLLESREKHVPAIASRALFDLYSKARAIEESVMKAMVYHEYGSPDNLKLEEIEMPAVKDDEVLVKVQATSVNWLDWHFLTGTPFLACLMAGLLKPKNKVLGIDLAGRVEAVGAKITQFQPGDEVFVSSSHGCFAEYVCVSEADLTMKPANLTFEEAAAVLGAAVTALHALRDHGNIQPGQQVLINGASGGVGTFAVQIAKSLGADVTGVCSTRNLDMVDAIGADHVFDYTQYDFTQNGEYYDLIFDAVAKRSFSDCERAVKPQGINITTAFSPVLALRARLASMARSKKMVPLPPKPPNKTDQDFIKVLLESGTIAPVIDRTYPLNQIPDALRYLEKGHAQGKIVITM